MKKLFVLGIVAALVFGLAAMAGAYTLSLTVSGGPIVGAISSSQVDFGDYQNGILNDETYIPPTAASYVEVTTPSIYSGAQTIGTFGTLAQTKQDFQVWTVGTVATPIDLYAELADDGTGNESGGSWGGSATPLSDYWTVPERDRRQHSRGHVPVLGRCQHYRQRQGS